MNTTAQSMRARGVGVFYGGLRASGATALTRRVRDAALILCYHNVVSLDEAPSQSGDCARSGDPELHMPFDRFERQMRWLADRYEVLSLRHLAQRVACGGSLRGAAAITFDDGYAGVFEHAVPLLRAMRMPATVFVVANAPGTRDGFWWDHPAVIDSLTPERRQRWLHQLQGDGAAILSEVDGAVADDGAAGLGSSYRPADWSVINDAVSQGIDVGVHSASHRALPTLSDAELEYEVSASREVIHRATNVWPQFFAYPYGLSDARTCAAVRRAGYLGGLGLETGLNDMSRDTSCWRRVNVPAGISLSAFDAWAAGLCLRRSR